MASRRAKPTETDRGRQPRRRKPNRATIAKRAYQLYRAEGGGDPDRHCLQAEPELQGG